MAKHDTDVPADVEPEERTRYIDTGRIVREDTLEQFDAIQEIPKKNVTDDQLREDVNNPHSWLQYNKGLEETGYTPASALTPGTVDTLERAYTIQVDSAGMETNPIVVPTDPPVMYFTEMNHRVHAVNARTGKEYWNFQPALHENIVSGRDPLRDRGVAVWQDKMYLTTNVADIIALNRYTGEKQWEVSTYTREQREDLAIDPARRLGISAAPMVFDGRVYIGHSADEGGFAAVGAFDAETGERAWDALTIDQSGWVGDSWRFGSGGAWMNAAIDPESNTVFWVTANPGPAVNGTVRPGPNNDTNSVMAFDTESGELKWTYQSIPHELWDYDFTHVPTVHDMETNGETRRVVTVEGKEGWVHTLDVETGQLITRSEGFARQDHSAFGRSFLSMPPRGKENLAIMWPLASGANEWPPAAYSPKTELRYIGANHSPSTIAYDPDWVYHKENVRGFEVGGWLGVPESLGSEVKSRGYLVAIDPASGKVAWRSKLGDIDASAPSMWVGGTMVTAGNVAFIGSYGGHLYAFDATSGDQLWKDDTGSRITAGPISWADPATGEPFVSIASNDKIITYSSDRS